MSFSKQLINGFIKTELDLYIKRFDESPVPEIQDKRSLAIAWLCYYFKDSISNENTSALIHFGDDVYSRSNYSSHGWFRISAIQAAAFILSSDLFYANSLIQHIDCAQGWARGFIIESTSIICPLLSFDNQYLKVSAENNIKYSQGLYEESIILFLSTSGPPIEKLKWLENQIIVNDKDYQKKFLSNLITAGRLNHSGFFVRTFNKIKSYIIFKMLCQPIFAEYQPTLFDETNVIFEELYDLEKKHPLNDYYIDLGFLTNEK